MNRPCSGCGRISCSGDCYSEDADDSGKTLDELIAQSPPLQDYRDTLRAGLNAGLTPVEFKHIGKGVYRVAA